MVDEYVPPGVVENLALHVDHREVPVPKSDDGLEVAQLTGQEGPEGSLQAGSGRLDKKKYFLLTCVTFPNSFLVQ